MTEKVWAAVLEKPNSISMKQFDTPKIDPTEALLKIEMVGVCGTDPSFYQGKLRLRYPVILGHEIEGHIAEIGDVASEECGLKRLDHVIVAPMIRCNRCYYCLTGEPGFCTSPKRRLYGVSRCDTPPYLWGGYAEYMYIAPGSLLFPIPQDLPAEVGVLICAVLADSIQWVRLDGGVAIGDTVVIQGAGQQGLCAVIAAKESGASPIILTRRSKFDKQREELARMFGADYTLSAEETDVTKAVREITGGKMADVVLDVTGDPQGLLTSISLVRKKGVLVCASSFGGSAIPIVMDKLVERAIRLQCVLGQGVKAVEAAIKLAVSRKYPLERMVTHKFSLKDAEEALRVTGRLVEGVKPIKTVIVP